MEGKRQEYLARKTIVDALKKRSNKAKEETEVATKEGGNAKLTEEPEDIVDKPSEEDEKDDKDEENGKDDKDEKDDKDKKEEEKTNADDRLVLGDHELEEEDESPMHDSNCDGCGMAPIKGPLFKCLEYVFPSTPFDSVVVLTRLVQL